MLFNVPQYITVEDKVAGPLTVKQLLWMIALGAILLLMWFSLSSSREIFFVLAIPITLLFVALAFYKPYGQPLISFVIAGIVFLFGPKVYVWRRTPPKMKTVSMAQKNKQAETRKESSSHEERRQAALKNISGIAKILDSGGEEADSGVVDVLKVPERRK